MDYDFRESERDLEVQSESESESEMKVLVAWCSSIQQFESVKEKKERKSGLSMWSANVYVCNVM